MQKDTTPVTSPQPFSSGHRSNRGVATVSSTHPLILTPGDNDWTDCHGVETRKFDPLQRVAKLRTMFFPEGRSLGQRMMPVISQAADPQFSEFGENLRWSMGGVTFVTLHIVGSNDNFGRTPEMDEEHRERKAAESTR